MADEVKSGVGETRERRMFLLELLHVIFAEFAQTQSVRFADYLRRKFLGHRNERDFRASTASALRGVPYPLLYPLKAFTKHVVSRSITGTALRLSACPAPSTSTSPV